MTCIFLLMSCADQIGPRPFVRSNSALPCSVNLRYFHFVHCLVDFSVAPHRLHCQSEAGPSACVEPRDCQQWSSKRGDLGASVLAPWTTQAIASNGTRLETELFVISLFFLDSRSHDCNAFLCFGRTAKSAAASGNRRYCMNSFLISLT